VILNHIVNSKNPLFGWFMF